jgi:hypothetical protein
LRLSFNLCRVVKSTKRAQLRKIAQLIPRTGTPVKSDPQNDTSMSNNRRGNVPQCVSDGSIVSSEYDFVASKFTPRDRKRCKSITYGICAPQTTQANDWDAPQKTAETATPPQEPQTKMRYQHDLGAPHGPCCQSHNITAYRTKPKQNRDLFIATCLPMHKQLRLVRKIKVYNVIQQRNVDTACGNVSNYQYSALAVTEPIQVSSSRRLLH